MRLTRTNAFKRLTFAFLVTFFSALSSVLTAPAAAARPYALPTTVTIDFKGQDGFRHLSKIERAIIAAYQLKLNLQLTLEDVASDFHVTVEQVKAADVFLPNTNQEIEWTADKLFAVQRHLSFKLKDIRRFTNIHHQVSSYLQIRKLKPKLAGYDELADEIAQSLEALASSANQELRLSAKNLIELARFASQVDEEYVENVLDLLVQGTISHIDYLLSTRRPEPLLETILRPLVESDKVLYLMAFLYGEMKHIQVEKNFDREAGPELEEARTRAITYAGEQLKPYLRSNKTVADHFYAYLSDLNLTIGVQYHNTFYQLLDAYLVHPDYDRAKLWSLARAGLESFHSNAQLDDLPNVYPIGERVNQYIERYRIEMSLFESDEKRSEAAAADIKTVLNSSSYFSEIVNSRDKLVLEVLKYVKPAQMPQVIRALLLRNFKGNVIGPAVIAELARRAAKEISPLELEAHLRSVSYETKVTPSWHEIDFLLELFKQTHSQVPLSVFQTKFRQRLISSISIRMDTSVLIDRLEAFRNLAQGGQYLVFVRETLDRAEREIKDINLLEESATYRLLSRWSQAAGYAHSVVSCGELLYKAPEEFETDDARFNGPATLLKFQRN